VRLLGSVDEVIAIDTPSFPSICSPTKLPSRPGVKQIESKTEQDDNTMIWTITGGRQVEGYHIYLNLDKKPVRMELDTGAVVSVMSEQ